jgi:DNA-binding transcriptional regulator GbsR (MarR family)
MLCTRSRHKYFIVDSVLWEMTTQSKSERRTRGVESDKLTSATKDAQQELEQAVVQLQRSHGKIE